MIFDNKGSVAGIIIAGISVIAVIAAVAGIADNNNLLQRSSQAALNSTGIMLQEGTLNVNRIDDNHVEISGKICYSTYLQTGGREEWTLWATDDRGKALDGNGTSDHIDGGRLFVSPDGSFPAKCEYTNRETGEGKLIDKNPKSPHRFSVVATTPRRLQGSYCPDVYLQYRGTWFSGTPFAKVKLQNFEGVCQPQAASTPTPTLTPATPLPATPSPTGTSPTATATPSVSATPTITLTPTLTPTPTPRNTITGRVSVYGCRKPSRATVEFCTGETCNLLAGGKIAALASTNDPSVQGIWPVDDNDDNTWIYEYAISLDENNQPLDPQKTYFLPRALGFFDNDTLFFDSERENADKLRLKPGQKRDFKVYATRTCGCSFDAVSYVKDRQGNLITDFDNKGSQYGTANNKQRFDRGDKPVESAPFNNLGNNPGRIDVHVQGDLGDFRDARHWGRDALANNKLYADGWRVVGQQCTSKNPDVPACPDYTDTWSASDMSKLLNPNVFENLRVACGVNVEYGWILEKAPPTPTPVPPLANGRIDIGIFVLVDDEKQKPDSCELDVLRNTSPREGIEQYFSDCDISIKEEHTGEVVAHVRKDRACNEHLFENIPPGTYQIQIKGLPGNTNDACLEKRTVTVEPGQTAKSPIVLVLDTEQCDFNHATETTCGSDDEGKKNGCRGAGGKCLGRLAGGSWLCCVENGSNGENGRGGDQGGCSTENGLLCTGTGHGFGSVDEHPDDPNKSGEAMCSWKDTTDPQVIGNWVGWCSSNHDNACCRVAGREGNRPEEPGQPGNPGTPGQPGSGSSCPAGTFGNPYLNGEPFADDPNDPGITDAHRRSICSDVIGPELSTPVSVNNGYGYCCGSNQPGSGPGNSNGGLGFCGAGVIGTVRSPTTPHGTRGEAEDVCRERANLENKNGAVVPATNGSGFCCQLTAKDAGTCRTRDNEYGKLPTESGSIAFDRREHAQTACDVFRETGRFASTTVVTAHSGAGFCCKAVPRSTEIACPANYTRHESFVRSCADGSTPYRERDWPYNLFCCRDTDTSPPGGNTLSSCASKGILYPGSSERCTSFAENHSLKNKAFSCTVEGGLQYECCAEDDHVDKPTGSEAECKGNEHSFTIRYKGKLGSFERLKFYPQICWGSPQRCQDYDAHGYYGLPFLNSFEVDTVFEHLTANRFTIKCKIDIGILGSFRDNCEDITIDIPADKGKCKEYKFELSGSELIHNEAGGSCGSGGSLDFNDDGVINTIDLQYIYDDYGNDTATADLNSDGNVNALDLSIFMSAFGTEINL